MINKNQIQNLIKNPLEEEFEKDARTVPMTEELRKLLSMLFLDMDIYTFLIVKLCILIDTHINYSLRNVVKILEILRGI